MNQNDTITIEVTFPDGRIQNIELAIMNIGKKREYDKCCFITVYNNNIYSSKGGLPHYYGYRCLDAKRFLQVYLTYIGFAETIKTYNFETNTFEFRYVDIITSEKRQISLYLDKDEDDKIGTFIRENGLFGVNDNLYVLK